MDAFTDRLNTFAQADAAFVKGDQAEELRLRTELNRIVVYSENMVVEYDDECAKERTSTHYNCFDLLCVACGWTGHFSSKGGEAPWPIFKNHKCRSS